MKGNEIILSSNPKGVFLEGIVSGTPKPGTVMKQTNAALSNGRPTWAAGIPGSSGDPALIAVLLPDRLQGKDVTDAYVDGTRCFLYCPVAGEELNMLVKDIAGTGDDHAVADIFMVDASTGKLIADSSGKSKAFICQETITDPTADTLTHCMYTGH